MPKLKTHQGANKRIKRTANDKLLRRRAFGNHNFQKKSPARKRRYAREYRFSDDDKKNVKALVRK